MFTKEIHTWLFDISESCCLRQPKRRDRCTFINFLTLYLKIIFIYQLCVPNMNNLFNNSISLIFIYSKDFWNPWCYSIGLFSTDILFILIPMIISISQLYNSPLVAAVNPLQLTSKIKVSSSWLSYLLPECKQSQHTLAWCFVHVFNTNFPNNSLRWENKKNYFSFPYFLCKSIYCISVCKNSPW